MTTRQHGKGATRAEQSWTQRLLAKANTHGKARPMTTAETLAAMNRVQQAGARYQTLETRR